MILNEKCKDWTVQYDAPLLRNLTDEEQKALRYLLHLVGDSIAVYAQLPDVDNETKEEVLTDLQIIMEDAKEGVIHSVDSALSDHAYKAPLTEELQEQNLFGFVLKDTLRLTFKTEAEEVIAAEHFPPLKEDWEDEDSDPV